MEPILKALSLAEKLLYWVGHNGSCNICKNMCLPWKTPHHLVWPSIGVGTTHSEILWQRMGHDADWSTLAGVLLNSHYLNNFNMHDNVDVKCGLLRALRKFVNNNNEDLAWAIMEYNALEEGGASANMPNIMQANLHEWWDLVGKVGPITKILAHVCSVSLYEWHWLMYCFKHSKSHNRLTTQRAKNLTYLYTNIRLQRDWMGCSKDEDLKLDSNMDEWTWDDSHDPSSNGDNDGLVCHADNGFRNDDDNSLVTMTIPGLTIMAMVGVTIHNWPSMSYWCHQLAQYVLWTFSPTQDQAKMTMRMPMVV